jgi:hypothetical protein
MALKITSGAWIAANRENREQRNSKRQQTFDEAGVKPASSLREVHVPAKARLGRTVALFPDAAGSRIKDDNLAAITERMNAAISAIGLSAPPVMRDVERQTLGILGYSPEVLKAFFDADHDTSLERSMSD